MSVYDELGVVTLHTKRSTSSTEGPRRSRRARGRSSAHLIERISAVVRRPERADAGPPELTWVVADSSIGSPDASKNSSSFNSTAPVWTPDMCQLATNPCSTLFEPIDGELHVRERPDAIEHLVHELDPRPHAHVGRVTFDVLGEQVDRSKIPADQRLQGMPQDGSGFGDRDPICLPPCGLLRPACPQQKRPAVATPVGHARSRTMLAGRLHDTSSIGRITTGGSSPTLGVLRRFPQRGG